MVLNWFLISIKFPKKWVVTLYVSKFLLSRHFQAAIMDFWPRPKKGMYIFFNPYGILFQNQKPKKLYVDVHAQLHSAPAVQR